MNLDENDPCHSQTERIRTRVESMKKKPEASSIYYEERRSGIYQEPVSVYFI